MPGLRVLAQAPTAEGLTDALLRLWADLSGSTLIMFDRAGGVVGWGGRVPDHCAAMGDALGLRLIDQSGQEPQRGAKPFDRVLAEGRAVLDEVWLFTAGENRRVVFVDCWPVERGGALMMLTPPQKWASRSRDWGLPPLAKR